MDVDNMTSACDTLMEHRSDPWTCSLIIKTQKTNLVLIDPMGGFEFLAFAGDLGGCGNQ